MSEQRRREGSAASKHQPFKPPRLTKSSRYHNLSSTNIGEKIKEPIQKVVSTSDRAVNTDPEPKPKPKPSPVTRDTQMNTDPEPVPEKVVKDNRDRGVNTDPPPKSPPAPRKISYGTNTVPMQTISRGTGTNLQMDTIVSRGEMETRIQEAIFQTEEEIMGCPLLQKAMAKVEEEAIHGHAIKEDLKETIEVSCQVGDENLRPFVISVGLQCKLDDVMPIVFEANNQGQQQFASSTTSSKESLELKSRVLDMSMEKIVRSIGVGECKVIEDPKEPAKFREIGVCTEKWVEVIKASKQTDTEDFAFKDTESPRVADMIFEPSPERIVLERRSSLRFDILFIVNSKVIQLLL